MSPSLWLLPALPAVAGALLIPVRRAAAALSVAVSIAVAAATLGLAVHAAVTRPSATARLIFGEGLAVDGLSAVMVVTVAAVGLAVLVFAAGERRSGRFHGLMLIFLGAMLATVTATDLVLLLMGWEVIGAMSYALIGYRWRDREHVRSGAVAFVTTRAGDLGLYVACGAALAGGGGLALAGLPGLPPPWRDLVAGGVVLAALGKSAQGPFAFWLSRAMVGPSPVSAFLHAATMVVAGAYLLMRLHALLAVTGWAAAVVAWTGAVTALLLGLVAVAQRDLKQLLAASTCAQVGFMVLAAGVSAVSGGAAHLVAHAAVKSLLFLAAGAWLAALGTKDLAGLHGAARRFPLVGVVFAVGAAALAGVPPLSLWVTKDAVLAGVGQPGLRVVAFAAGLVAALYAGKALAEVWRPADTATGAGTVTATGAGAGAGTGAGTGTATATGAERRASGGVAGAELLPLPVLALVAAGFGVVGLPAVHGWWSRLVGDPGAPGLTAGELALSGIPALALVTAAIAVRPGTSAFPYAGGVFGRWLGLERVARGVVWGPLLGAARWVAWFDERVVQGAVEAVARAGLGAARLAGSPFEAGLDDLVRRAGGAVRRLGGLARRPQTGQVHTYFAQAVVALVVLAVVFAIVR
ncbi:proton-conducting transporter membrane subunit [Nonomuraea sp. NPDC047529]|uniref:proton-conducting transporter transmembrane domain-containing protein n=1 Tax=Nonomuraea sp. NPDC047529 TaxID=3155623 RepID=UPI0033CFA720